MWFVSLSLISLFHFYIHSLILSFFFFFFLPNHKMCNCVYYSCSCCWLMKKKEWLTESEKDKLFFVTLKLLFYIEGFFLKKQIFFRLMRIVVSEDLISLKIKKLNLKIACLMSIKQLSSIKDLNKSRKTDLCSYLFSYFSKKIKTTHFRLTFLYNVNESVNQKKNKWDEKMKGKKNKYTGFF